MKAKKIISVCSVLLLLVTLSTNASDRFWVASTSSNFNNTANWSATSGGAGGASVPSVSDIAIFDGGGLGNCALDIGVNVAGLTVTSAYSGTITQGNTTVTVGSSGAGFLGGTFAGGTANITVQGDLTIGANAVFTSTSGILEVKGDYILSGTGTFNHNNGSVKFSANFLESSTITGSTTFNNLEFRFIPLNVYGISAGTELTAIGTLALSGNDAIIINTGRINAQGDITITNISGSFATGSALININGSGNQTLTGSGIANIGWLQSTRIFKPSGTLFLNGIISVHGDWNYISGNVDAVTNNSTVIFLGGGNIGESIIDGEGIGAIMKFNNVTLRGGFHTLRGDLVVQNVLISLFASKLILNSNTLILENGNSNAFLAEQFAGIVSETPNDESKIQWNIGENVGNYIIPFITDTGVEHSITMNITIPGTQLGIGNFVFSTFPTSADNLPSPAFVGEIRNSSNVNIALDAVDRFWKIEATNYSINPEADITFRYLDNEVVSPNSINELDLKAFRWTGTRWEKNPINVADPVANAVIAPNVNTFSSWALVEGHIPLTNHDLLCIDFASELQPHTKPCITDAIDFCFDPLDGFCAPSTACDPGNLIDGCSINCTCPNCAERRYTVFYDNNGGLAIPQCSIAVLLPPGVIFVSVVDPLPPNPPICPPSSITSVTNVSLLGCTQTEGTLLEWFYLCDVPAPFPPCVSINQPLNAGSFQIRTHIACCTKFCTTFDACAALTPPFASCPAFINDVNVYCGPFDPNSKIINSPNPCEIIEKTDTLNYQITFQNLGTAPATNVTIIDTLDFENLDVSTVETIQTSFPVSISIMPPGIITWTFTNINLPDSASDPEGSIGFLKYRVIPVPDIVPGTVIEDRAAIIFDNLLPIITSTTKVTIEGTPITADAGPDVTISLGQSDTLTASISGGTPPYEFLWSTGETTSAIIVSPTDTATFTVSVADANGCSDADEVKINVIGPEDCSNFPCGNNKVVVCHFPPGKPGNPQTICVSENSVNAHLTNHGDVCGPCGGSKWGGYSEQDNDENLESEPDLLDFENRHLLQNTTTIFPNPSPGQFTLLMLPDVIKTETSVYLYNVLGEVIYKNDKINKPYLDFDISDQSKGIYFVKVLKGNDMFVDKIIYQ